MQPKIAIIGGGVAGLATGIALRQKGFSNVFIFERDTSFSDRRQGYGLTLMQGLSALRQLGLADKVREELDAPALAHYTFHGPTGNLLGLFGTVLWSNDSQNISAIQSNKRNLHVSRQALRGLLLNEYDGNICWNSRLTDLEENNGLLLKFDNGTQSKVDIVIGADGINSIVRNLVYPFSSSLEYLCVVVVLGIATISKIACFGSNDTIFESVDGKYRFYAMPHREPFSLDNKNNLIVSNLTDSTSYMWQLSFLVENECEAIKLTSKNERENLMSYIVKELGSWHRPIPELISNTPLSLLMSIPIYDRGANSCLPADFKEGIWLIGDAAHPMSPFKGQGANQALIDAIQLANLLANYFQCIPNNIVEACLPKKKKYKKDNFSNSDSVDMGSIGISKENIDPVTDANDTFNPQRKNIGIEAMRIFYEKVFDRVVLKILKSRERIKRYHTPSEVLSVQSYCYGEHVTPSFISHLNSLTLNATKSDHKEPLYIAVKKELQVLINNKIN